MKSVRVGLIDTPPAEPQRTPREICIFSIGEERFIEEL
jgi:hypothetical protein